MSPSADPYLFGHGDDTYGVQRYDLDLDYRVSANALRATATLSIVALTKLDSIVLDLHGLAVRTTSVDGKPAKHRHTGDRLVVRLPARLGPGASARVVVTYGGRPRPLDGCHGEAGWEELDDGALVASQPHGAPTWFPCNDRPSDKARYRISVTTESAYDVAVTGTLVKKVRKASRQRWSYELTKPTPTYLVSVHIGRYASTTIPGPVPIRVHHPSGERARVLAAFGGLGAMVKAFSRRFGPYPFAGYEVVVTHDDLEIPLEAQGMATFGRNYLVPGWERERLVAHELAHQWFGNSVTVQHWRDIWLHEGFACYAEWLWSEESGRRTAHEHAMEHWAHLTALKQDLLLADPGPKLMFDDRVYKRGALAVHAVRLTLGEARFFAMLRDWLNRERYASVTTAQFVRQANRYAVRGRPLDPVFDAWLFRKPMPPLPRGSARRSGAGPALRGIRAGRRRH